MRFRKKRPALMDYEYHTITPTPLIIKELGVLRDLKPNDCVVITPLGNITPQQAEHIRSVALGALQCRVLIMAEGLEITRAEDVA